MIFQFLSTIKVNLEAKIRQSAYLCVILDVKHKKKNISRCFKGAVSRQSSSFCLILLITRPQSLWNLDPVYMEWGTPV